MGKFATVPSSQVVATKIALVAFLEDRVKYFAGRIALYKKSLAKYRQSGDTELSSRYERKLQHAEAVKNACAQTIIRQKQYIKGK